MNRKGYRRLVAGGLIVLGSIQASTLFGRGDLLFALCGIGYVIAGVLFWFDV